MMDMKKTKEKKKYWEYLKDPKVFTHLRAEKAFSSKWQFIHTFMTNLPALPRQRNFKNDTGLSKTCKLINQAILAQFAR